MLWRVLLGLRIPGAWLGAALWGVASGDGGVGRVDFRDEEYGVMFSSSCFRSSSFVRAVRSEEMRDGPWNYAGCFVFAVLALTSKSSTVVLPVVFCLCVWWMEGRWQWRTLARTAPVFVLALLMAVVSVWTQQQAQAFIVQAPRSWGGAVGHGGRCRLVLPRETRVAASVMPHVDVVYPHWEVHPDRVVAWLPLLAVVALMLTLYMNRKARPAFLAFRLLHYCAAASARFLWA